LKRGIRYSGRFYFVVVRKEGEELEPSAGLMAAESGQGARSPNNDIFAFLKPSSFHNYYETTIRRYTNLSLD
jgi:hypothetical protein